MGRDAGERGVGERRIGRGWLAVDGAESGRGEMGKNEGLVGASGC